MGGSLCPCCQMGRGRRLLGAGPAAGTGEGKEVGAWEGPERERGQAPRPPCSSCVMWGLCVMRVVWHVAGVRWGQRLRSQGQDKPPQPPQAQCWPPRPSWLRPRGLLAEATCSGSARESLGLLPSVPASLLPIGHAASILIKSGCRAGGVRQGAPAGPRTGVGGS